MKARRVQWLLGSLTGVLLMGVSFNFLSANMIDQPRRRMALKNLVAPPPPGWTVSFQEVAESPEMKKTVAEVLNYDDAIYVTYSNGLMSINMYAAYWSAGKMSHRLIANHTPDVCWVNAGWGRVETRTTTSLRSANRLLLPAEERLMNRGTYNVGVVFWHIVGDNVVRYEAGRPPWFALFADVLRHGLRQREEQFFIRISGDGPVSSWWDSPVVERLVKDLSVLYRP